MASEYIYDEEGETWPYFVLAVLSFALIPITIKWSYNIISGAGARKTNLKIRGALVEDSHTIGTDNASQVSEYQKSQTSAKIFNKTLIVLILGWAIVYYVATNFTQIQDVKVGFDPYSILDISAFASEREIKSRYRKLSLKFHPDKLPKDVTEAAKQEMEASFIRINLAYKALTDEVTRENFLKYGHPDGPQEIFHGIAIPKFLVEGKYSPVMIVIYFLLIGVFLPLVVGTWWRNVKTHTKKGLHVETAALFTRKLADRNPALVVTPSVLLDWLLISNEIRLSASHLTPEETKNLVLKFTNREFVEGRDQLSVVSKLPDLISGFLDIAIVFRQTETVLAAFDLQKSLLQAVKLTGKYQELLQLPYVDPKVVENQPVKKLGKLFTMSEEEAKKTLGINDPAKLQKALNVAAHIPSLRVVNAEFKVPGEDVVPPASSAHLVLHFLVKSPKLKSIPKISEDKFKEEETFEYLRDPLGSNNEQPLLPFAYAPYLPHIVHKSWSGLLVAHKDGKLIEGSKVSLLENIDLSNLELTQQEWKDGQKVIVSSFKIQLPTPTPFSKGTHHYRLLLKSNAYFGSDVDISVELDVQLPPIKIPKKVEKKDSDSEDDSESDISDPEEDTLAGALAALRGQSVRKAASNESDQSDESDNESIFTDINTDTEDEGGN